MKGASVPESSIIKLTGHKSTEGLKNYDPGDQSEFKQMSDAISGETSRSLIKSSSSSATYLSPSASTAGNNGSTSIFNQCNVTINNVVSSNTNSSTKKRKCHLQQ